MREHGAWTPNAIPQATDEPRECVIAFDGALRTNARRRMWDKAPIERLPIDSLVAVQRYINVDYAACLPPSALRIPVCVYRVGDVHVIADGNHRANRCLGHKSHIAAHVVRLSDADM